MRRLAPLLMLLGAVATQAQLAPATQAQLAPATTAQPAPATEAVAEPTAARQATLVRMVRQDCGSCHGMRLTGGLGPPLQPAALADKPVASMAATIYHGRPGTPMPGWRSLLSEADALWIAQRLAQGFPEEPPRGNP